MTGRSQPIREVGLLTVKRLPLRWFGGGQGGGKYGHWWIEIGDPFDFSSESYGWWPKTSVGLLETAVGVEGELNATSRFKSGFMDAQGVSVRDPHHGDAADVCFHPLVAESDGRTDLEIADCIRQQARKFSGKWQWVLEAGSNCHTFQLALLEGCGLLEPREFKSGILPLKYRK